MADVEDKAGRPGANVPEYSVSELSGAIKRTLEDGFGYVRLRGEVSGYRGPHSSGHCYFALKDDKAKIEAVIWRGVFQKLKVKPEEGLEVVAQGRVTTYPGSSKYQVVIETIEPAGIGALMALLEARKKQFAAEGLFDEARKQLIPFLPRVVGIVTSPTGAVIRDMLAGFTERFPAHVLLWPVRVQGETSAGEVAAAIKGFNALKEGGPVPRPDVIIVARGGGSLEDLWGFNEEVAVRAAAESFIPLISAVGHETDWTLIDLVADARAPTPTKAAEWAVPKYAELIDQQSDFSSRLRGAIVRLCEKARSGLKAAVRGLPRSEELLGLARQRFDSVEKRLGAALLSSTRTHATRLAQTSGRLHIGHLKGKLSGSADRVTVVTRAAREAMLRRTGDLRKRYERPAARLSVVDVRRRMSLARERLHSVYVRSNRSAQHIVKTYRKALDSQVSLLQSLSYQSVLERGFALARAHDGAMVRRASGTEPGSLLELEFFDGRVTATVRSSQKQRSAKPESQPAAIRAPRKVKGPKQGSLF